MPSGRMKFNMRWYMLDGEEELEKRNQKWIPLGITEVVFTAPKFTRGGPCWQIFAGFVPERLANCTSVQRILL